jgi:hypothetical protein
MIKKIYYLDVYDEAEGDWTERLVPVTFENEDDMNVFSEQLVEGNVWNEPSIGKVD